MASLSAAARKDLHLRSRRQVASILRLLVSGGLIGVLLATIDLKVLLAHLAQTVLWPFLIAALILALQCAIAGARWRLIIGFNWSISVMHCIRFFWIGQFLNQILPSTIGGDAIRAYLLSRKGLGFPIAVMLTVVDRFVGVLALLLIMSAVLSIPSPIWTRAPELIPPLQLAAIIGFVSLMAMLLLPRLSALEPLRRYRALKAALMLAQEVSRLIATPSHGLAVLALAFIVHACSIFAFWLTAHSVGWPLALLDVALIVPPILFLSMLPVSVAGWGVRETAAVTALAMLDVPREVALSISVLFGLALLLASLPGGFLWQRVSPTFGLQHLWKLVRNG